MVPLAISLALSGALHRRPEGEGVVLSPGTTEGSKAGALAPACGTLSEGTTSARNILRNVPLKGCEFAASGCDYPAGQCDGRCLPGGVRP